MRIELFGDEIESARWFSTFTQRSLGEAERVELAPAAELDAEHRELAEMAALEAAEDGGRVSAIAELLPLDHFKAPLDLVPTAAAVLLTAAEEIEPASATTGTTSPRRCTPTTPSTSTSTSRARSPTGLALLHRHRRGQRGRLPRRPRRVAGTQHQGSRGRAREAGPLRLPHGGRLRGPRRGRAGPYNLDRLDAKLLDGRPLSPDPGLSFAEARLREGFVSPELRLAVYPIRRLVHRRRRAPESSLAGAGRPGCPRARRRACVAGRGSRLSSCPDGCAVSVFSPDRSC